MQVARHESARIVLRGRSEFEAHDVTLAGDLLFEVSGIAKPSVVCKLYTSVGLGIAPRPRVS